MRMRRMRMRRKRRMKRAVMIPVIRVNGTFGPNFNIITLFDAHRQPRSVATCFMYGTGSYRGWTCRIWQTSSLAASAETLETA